MIVVDVLTLVGTASIDSGQANALQSSLSNALAKLDQGNTTAAVNNLEAFINKVEAFVKAGNLSATDGRELIDAVNAAIASVQS